MTNDGVYWSDTMTDQPMCRECTVCIYYDRDRKTHEVIWCCPSCGRRWHVDEIQFGEPKP